MTTMNHLILDTRYFVSMFMCNQSPHFEKTSNWEPHNRHRDRMHPRNHKQILSQNSNQIHDVHGIHLLSYKKSRANKTLPTSTNTIHSYTKSKYTSLLYIWLIPKMAPPCWLANNWAITLSFELPVMANDWFPANAYLDAKVTSTVKMTVNVIIGKNTKCTYPQRL